MAVRDRAGSRVRPGRSRQSGGCVRGGVAAPVSGQRAWHRRARRSLQPTCSTTSSPRPGRSIATGVSIKQAGRSPASCSSGRSQASSSARSFGSSFCPANAHLQPWSRPCSSRSGCGLWSAAATHTRPARQPTPLPSAALGVLAAAVGCVGGIYGIGGGSILAPVLVGSGRSPTEVAPATLASTFVTSIAGVVTFVILSSQKQGAVSPDWGSRPRAGCRRTPRWIHRSAPAAPSSGSPHSTTARPARPRDRHSLRLAGSGIARRSLQSTGCRPAQPRCRRGAR